MIPIGQETSTAERTRTSIAIGRNVRSVSKRIAKLTGKMKEHRYRVTAIALKRSNANHNNNGYDPETDTGSYEDAKAQCDEVNRTFEQRQQDRLGAMKQRRQQYYEGKI